jgi:CD2 antigen cytoplasmic tail-binding protein 2
LNDLTGAANALLLKGNVDIYQKTRKELVCQLPPQLGRMKTATKQKALWEYMGNQDGAIHGPFTTEQMHGWIAQGYFVGPTAVQVRSVIEQPKETSLKDDLLSDLMDDDDDTAATPSALERVRGDWMQSDQVVFTSYT